LQSASNIQRPVLLFVFYASTRVHRRTVRDAFFFYQLFAHHFNFHPPSCATSLLSKLSRLTTVHLVLRCSIRSAPSGVTSCSCSRSLPQFDAVVHSPPRIFRLFFPKCLIYIRHLVLMSLVRVGAGTGRQKATECECTS
jgi:hypothetical protein